MYQIEKILILVQSYRRHHFLHKQIIDIHVDDGSDKAIYVAPLAS